MANLNLYRNVIRAKGSQRMTTPITILISNMILYIFILYSSNSSVYYWQLITTHRNILNVVKKCKKESFAKGCVSG